MIRFKLKWFSGIFPECINTTKQKIASEYEVSESDVIFTQIISPFTRMENRCKYVSFTGYFIVRKYGTEIRVERCILIGDVIATFTRQDYYGNKEFLLNCGIIILK